MDCHHNSEEFLGFVILILQKQQHTRGRSTIHTLIKSRLDDWDLGHFHVLVTSAVSDMTAQLKSKHGVSTPEERLETFQHLSVKGEKQKAIRFLSEREEATCILDPEQFDENSGQTIFELLDEKHPKPDTTLSPLDLPVHPTVPVGPKLLVTPGTVADVAQQLKGTTGLGGTDGPTLKGWFLCHKGVSKTLCKAVARLTKWLSNDIRPWEAIRALMSNRLIALDKKPGVRPIGIGQIWQRLMAKTMVPIAGPIATDTCGTDQLCAGLKAGIEGGAAQFWKKMASEPDFGFFLANAMNAFNFVSQVITIWNVRCSWAITFHFRFNCCCHCGLLVVHSSSGARCFLHSEDGVTQGDPLAMILCDHTVLPMIRDLKSQFKNLLHLWFADNGNAGGKLQELKQFSTCLK